MLFSEFRCKVAQRLISPTEVVLCTLLEQFKLSVPADLPQPIYWNFGGVQWPSVGRTSEKAELPLTLELLRKEKA